MCHITTPRERITPKDLMRLLGYQKTKAYQYYNEIKAAIPHRDSDLVLVDDVVSFTGISREAVKSSLAK